MSKLFWVALRMSATLVVATLWVETATLAAQGNRDAAAVDAVASPGSVPSSIHPADFLTSELTESHRFYADLTRETEGWFSRIAGDRLATVPKPTGDEISPPTRAEETNPLADITSVSQLSDVQPTDWAFQALQSLVERYGAIAGYPDGTFRGDRALSRYEFAVGLNAALARIEQLLQRDRDRITAEDWRAIERLQTDFATELAQVRQRLDNLEARTALIAGNQFSTITKLNGVVTFNLATAGTQGDVRVNRIDPNDVFSAAARGADGEPIVTKVKDDPQTTFSQVTLLFLTTSFTGEDSLIATLAAGNGNSPANNYTSAGLFNTFGVSTLDFTPSANPNELVIVEAFYSFPVTSSVQLAVGPQFFWSRYFDTNAFTSSIGKGASGFNTFGSPLVNDLARGSGAVLTWGISEQFDLRLGYVGGLDSANPTVGLFDGNRAFTAQLTYSPTPNLNVRLLYDRSAIAPVDGQIKTRPLLGVADDGFGGSLEDATADAFGVNFDWLIAPKFGVFGRYTYATTHLTPETHGISGGDVTAQSLQLGVAFPDLGKQGALATLTYVVPFDLLDGEEFLVAGGGDGGTQYEFEAAYYFPLSDRIAIIPSLYAIGNPNNFDANPTIYTGTVNTQFTF